VEQDVSEKILQSKSSVKNANIVILLVKNKIEFSEDVQPVRIPKNDSKLDDLDAMLIGYNLFDLKSEEVHGNLTNCPVKNSKVFCVNTSDDLVCRNRIDGGMFIDKIDNEWKLNGIIIDYDRCDASDIINLINIAEHREWIKQSVPDLGKNHILIK
jgi:hypothetical protein